MEIKPFYLDINSEEKEDLKEELDKILTSGQLILSKNTLEFEKNFADYCGAKHAISVNTGTTALELLCILNNVKGKNIAVQSNTNFATIAAIIKAGGKPIFMDMTKEYFCPDLNILKYTCNKYKIEGVMWVHIGGIITPDFEEITAFCKSNNLILIEDCAHAHGSFLNSKCAGNFGNGGAYSFFPTKVMTTMEGGMIITNNDEHAESIKSFRNQGKRKAAYGGLHYDLGNSWRINELQAYMGIILLRKLNIMISKRQKAVDIISSKFKNNKVSFSDTSHMNQASQYKFIIHLKNGSNMNEIKNKLASKGSYCGGGVYETACHLQPVFEDIVSDINELKVTTKECPMHICPPITSGTTEEEAHYMAEEILKVL